MLSVVHLALGSAISKFVVVISQFKHHAPRFDVCHSVG